MAYKDILPQTNLAAVDIRDTIGCPSNNLADYCVKAKAGGAGGWAFKIIENGYLPTDGYLIAGAEPYFNIWSENAPSEWVATKTGNLQLKCRLRRNTYGDLVVKGHTFNANSYCFDLGSYRGYKHTSSGIVLNRQGEPPLREEDAFSEGVSIYISLGDIDWIKTIYQTTNIDRTKFYIEIATLQGGSYTFSSGKIRYDQISQYIPMYNVPIISSIGLNITLYEFDGAQYSIAAVLPIAKTGQFNLFDFTTTVQLFRIVYIPRIEQLRLINILHPSEDIFDLDLKLIYNTTYDYWEFTVDITYYMPSANLDANMVTEFTFVNKSNLDPKGNIQSYYISLLSESGNDKTSRITGRFPSNIGVGKSEDGQLYTLIIKYRY